MELGPFIQKHIISNKKTIHENKHFWSLHKKKMENAYCFLHINQSVRPIICPIYENWRTAR